MTRYGLISGLCWVWGTSSHLSQENIRVITPESLRCSDCSGHHHGFIRSYSILAGDEVTPLIVCLTYFLSPGAYFLMIMTLAVCDSSELSNLKYATGPVKISQSGADSGLKCLSCRHIVISTPCIRVPEVK